MVMNNKLIIICLSTFFFSMILLFGCGSNTFSDNNNENPGTYQARLIFPADTPRLTSEKAANHRIDCKAAGIATIQFHFSANGDQHQPFVFNCMDGNGIVKRVPTGEEIVVVVFANDVDSIPLLKGSEVVSVIPGQKTVGGEIVMEYLPTMNSSPSEDTNPQTDQGGSTSSDTDLSPSVDQDSAGEPAESDTDTQTEQDTLPETDTPLESDTDLPEEQDTSPGSTSAPPVESFGNDLGMNFVRIPGGTFTMGSPTSEPGREDDETRHQVTISSAFYMQTTEVTQRQWVSVMQTRNPSWFFACGSNCPVELITWNEVQQFIAVLNVRYQGEYTFRLPTEAEWEYAARARSTTAFANGDISILGCNYDQHLNAIGWYCFNSSVQYNGCFDNSDRNGNSCSGTHPVGQLSPNSFGMYDMSGNVAEMCQDYYGPYPTGPVTDYRGPETGYERVVRGGNWRISTRGCRSSDRQVIEPGRFFYNVGFRLICTPQ